MFTAYITPLDGAPRRVDIQAAHINQARLFARHRGSGLFGRLPFTYCVRPA